MKEINYLSLDPRTLEIFITVMYSSSMTQAADKLSITQSAVSHSLEKLRQLFDDALFVRSGRSVVPTQRAKDLLPEFETLLNTIKQLLIKSEFSPETMDFYYKIATNGAIETLRLPNLYQHLKERAKSISLDIISLEAANMTLFQKENVDLLITPVMPEQGGLMVKRLFADKLVCFYDPDARGKPVSKEDFDQASYISLSSLKNRQVGIQSSTNDFNLDDRIRIRVSSFNNIHAFLKGSQLLAVAPLSMANDIFSEFSYVDWSFQKDPVNIYMIWHSRSQNDPKHRWLRDQWFEMMNSNNGDK